MTQAALEDSAISITDGCGPGDEIDFKFGAARADQLFDSLSVRGVDEVVSLGVPSAAPPPRCHRVVPASSAATLAARSQTV